MTWREDFAHQRDLQQYAGQYEWDYNGEALRLFAEALIDGYTNASVAFITERTGHEPPGFRGEHSRLINHLWAEAKEKAG